MPHEMRFNALMALAQSGEASSLTTPRNLLTSSSLNGYDNG